MISQAATVARHGTISGHCSLLQGSAPEAVVAATMSAAFRAFLGIRCKKPRKLCS
ncbi:MAG: hypothetical protein KGJ79_16610 [Alphaproteobacteria bacterium]|nr:hypothetical protein [Alphaproteobacteria bacterium]MDE2492403.1 hypothetical protein [Alphaproteobacteria bacterium]